MLMGALRGRVEDKAAQENVAGPNPAIPLLLQGLSKSILTCCKASNRVGEESEIMRTLLTILAAAAIVPTVFRLADSLGKNKGFTSLLKRIHMF
jgi:hypothetical protein